MRTWSIFLLFFVSGGSGLIYQVVWSRLMGLLFGRSVLAVGIVLATFMAGLALGGYLLGKRADSSASPLRLYALYEVGIGLTAGLATFLLLNISPFYTALHDLVGESPLLLSAARFLLAFLLLVVPTTLMGATLPILSRVVITRLDRVGHELGRLYAINTLGAVGGTIAAGFFFIRLYGLEGAVFIAVASNLAVGWLAWFLSRRWGSAPAATVPRDVPAAPSVALNADIDSPKTGLLLLTVFALSGFTSFAYEIFWTRSLVFILGNTTYAFTLMLTAFLSGIALGGFLIRYLADRVKNRLLLFGGIEILIGLCSAASLPLLFYLIQSEWIDRLLQATSQKMGQLVFAEALVALLLMLVPATLIGTTLPLMGRIFVAELQHTGMTVGRLYAVNTCGNVAGALLPGLLILPLLGIQKGILLMALLNVGLGLVVLVSRWKHSLPFSMASLALFFLIGIRLADVPIDFQFPSSTQTQQDAVLYYREGGLVTTKVWKEHRSGNKIMSVDGINIGGTNDVDYKQQILAHLPKLLSRSYSSELSIGLGSGILIGESARHRQLEDITCVEIAPTVVEGARYFSRENHQILDDPRATIVVDDVGHFLRTTSARYDIISADGKTDEKYSTNAFSYSRDYYQLLRDRLAPEGLVIQWIPTALPAAQYNLVLRTFLDSFPHALHWYFPPVGRFFMSNTFLIGSNEPITIDPEFMQRALDADPAAFQGVRKYGLKTAEDFLVHFVADRQTLLSAVPDGPVNSVLHPYYEFYSPEDYNASLNQRVLVNQRFFMQLIGQDFRKAIVEKLPEPGQQRLRKAFAAYQEFLLGHQVQLANGSFRSALGHYKNALKADPDSGVLRQQIVANVNDQFRQVFYQNDIDNALALLRLATQMHPESAQVHEDYGMMLRYTNQVEAAMPHFQQALQLDSGLVPSHQALAGIYASAGQKGQALQHWQAALQADPLNIGTLAGYGVYLARSQSLDPALGYLEKAYGLAPKNPAVIHGYALALFLKGDYAMARHIVEAGGAYYQGISSYADLRDRIIDQAL